MIIDASVALKWIAFEDGSDLARELIGREELIAPTLLLTEVANALWKKARRDQVSPAVVFDDDLRALATLVSLRDEASLIPRALQIARGLGHPVHDCVYLALAEDLGEKFLTADARLLGIVRSSGWEHRVALLS